MDMPFQTNGPIVILWNQSFPILYKNHFRSCQEVSDWGQNHVFMDLALQVMGPVIKKEKTSTNDRTWYLLVFFSGSLVVSISAQMYFMTFYTQKQDPSSVQKRKRKDPKAGVLWFLLHCMLLLSVLEAGFSNGLHKSDRFNYSTYWCLEFSQRLGF